MTNSSDELVKFINMYRQFLKIPQGNYEPITRLIAPTKIQIATVLGKYNPSEKTNIQFRSWSE
ncbi:MAG: hypothetical protein U0T80_00960 [Flavobacteriaceae bacterium]